MPPTHNNAQTPSQQRNHKQIVVIGGGINGVCTAYYLAQAGHQVALIEQHGNVAEATTLGNSGLLAAATNTPWAAPDMRQRLLSGLFSQEAPNIFNARLSPSLWRWLLRWTSVDELQQYQQRAQRMQRLATYSQHLVQEVQQYFQIDFETSDGLLQLFRSEKEFAATSALQALFSERGIAHRALDADAARALEPALNYVKDTNNIAGGLYFPELATGNCTLFIKQLKTFAQEMGVQFHFHQKVQAITPDGQQVAIKIGEEVLYADAVVVAAGGDSARLLRPLGVRLPLQMVKTYTATTIVKNHDDAPKLALQDDAYKVTMARLGDRIRVAGIAEFGARHDDASIDDKALRTLLKVAQDWFPNAANYHNAQLWSGQIPMLLDAVPLLGATSNGNVYINLGHGANGWCMALGAAKAVADQISGANPEIDMDGLTLARYRQ
ncbi:FAD-dependent oxidoreductase [Glaciimonas soli]|uniref:FAD-dependent oxidoreductase n=1 Tax=Glaciimonas soli TaxID=2590999 RepID=A0A843YR17_9BURK|nr:FAD-dependent oxidoreductase [Glaciimonas soli]MQQ99721.1 FAD-dependent oxidoreductase [Glaciimonas soli]